METTLAPTNPAEVLRELEAGLDQLQDCDLSSLSAAELAEFQERSEIARRRLAAVQNDCLDTVDSTKSHQRDGHSSAKVMVRHQGKLSNAEALARQRVMGALRDLVIIDIAFSNGAIGVDQVRTLAKTWANERVRSALMLPERQLKFLHLAQTLSHRQFVIEVAKWERLIDEDGPDPANERNHRNRNFSIHQDPFGLGWTMDGSLGSTNGAEFSEIFNAYVKAEFEADWAEAKAIHGDKTMHTDLARTEAQRRADALLAMARHAASSGDTVPKDWVHKILWDHETFEEMARRFSGAEPQPLDPDTYRCETIDGIPVDPHEAFANALVNKIQRALVDSKSIIIDLGEARYFTRGAKAAVQLHSTCCIWPGCHVPTSDCEADHLTEHSRGGRTNPGNGAPLCGRHNRWKQKGFTIIRSPNGTWHVYRPDGTLIY